MKIRSREKHHDVLDRCVTQAWASLHPEIRRWIPEKQLRAHLATSISDELNRVGDAEFAASFHNAVPVSGAVPEDYGPRILETMDGGALIAGIRFRPDPPFSFVELYTRDFPIAATAILMGCMELVRDAFAVFTPKFLRIHVASGSTEDRVVNDVDDSTDFVTVAGLLATLRANHPPSRMERLHLESSPTLANYDRYVNEYALFHSAEPGLREAVPVASRETLDRSRAHGLLFDAYIDGEWAGIIAGREQTNYGMQGYRIIEEVLSSRFRGQGFGPALQRHFIDKLPATDDEVIHGAIDPANVPSLATAKRVGRIEVMHTYLVAL